MYVAVLAYVQIAGSGAAFPGIGLAVHQVLLEQAVVDLVRQRMGKPGDAFVGAELPFAERFYYHAGTRC